MGRLHDRVKKMFSDFYDVEFMDQLYSLRNLTGCNSKSKSRSRTKATNSKTEGIGDPSNENILSANFKKRSGFGSEVMMTQKTSSGSKLRPGQPPSSSSFERQSKETEAGDFSVISQITEHDPYMGDSLANILEQIGGGMSESKTKRGRFKKRRGISASSSLGGNLSDIGIEFGGSRVRRLDENRAKMEQIEEDEAENRRRRETQHAQQNAGSENADFTKREMRSGKKEAVKRVVTSLPQLETGEMSRDRGVALINGMHLTESIPVGPMLGDFGELRDEREIMENLKNMAVSLPPDSLYEIGQREGKSEIYGKKARRHTEDAVRGEPEEIAQHEFMEFLKSQNLGEFNDARGLALQLELFEQLQELRRSEQNQENPMLNIYCKDPLAGLIGPTGKSTDLQDSRCGGERISRLQSLKSQRERLETEASRVVSEILTSTMRSELNASKESEILEEYLTGGRGERKIVVSGLSGDTGELGRLVRDAPRRGKKGSVSEEGTFESELRGLAEGKSLGRKLGKSLL